MGEQTAGLIQQRRARSTGTLVSIYNAQAAGMDDYDGAYVVFCETHGALCNFPTLAKAREFAPVPFNFCETCQANIEGEES